MSAGPWQPAATLAALRLRAQLLAATREYFRRANVLEVETPILSHATVTDVHLASLASRIAGQGEFYLQTSPEYAMKRLLAAGTGDIYQIARVFRDGERGRLHNPEFTLVEWYRLGFDAARMMDDVTRLLSALFQSRRALGAAKRLTYRQAVLEYAGVDPIEAPDDELFARLRSHAIPLAPGTAIDRDACLDLLMSIVVAPRLGAGHLTFIHDYPASQAALARLNPQDARVAARFEVYLEGIELANGFHELADAAEQRRRFERDLAERRARRQPLPPIDEHMLAALQAGLPDCAGVAVGFDRVVMLAAGADAIDQVLAFPVERA